MDKDYMTEAEYLSMNQDEFDDFDDMETIRATTYNRAGNSMMYLKGKEMVGRNCPTCGSKLVMRKNRRDGRTFVACDKKNRKRCPFTIGSEETLFERTNRIENKIYNM